MRRVTTIQEMREAVAQARAGGARVGFRRRPWARCTKGTAH